MNKYLIASVAAVGLFGGAVVSFGASEGETKPQTQPRLVMEQAIALAQHYGQGAVIEAELEQKGDRQFYEAKVQSDNGTRTIYIDAHTAEVQQNHQL